MIRHSWLLPFKTCARLFCFLACFAIVAVSQAQLVSSGWAMIHGNQGQNGQSIGLNTTSMVQWTLAAEISGVTSFTSPVIGVDGTLYVGEFGKQQVVAVNPANGSIKWVFLTAGINTYTSLAVGADGTVYVAGYESNSPNNGAIYALQGSNGDLKWTVNLDYAPSPIGIGPDNSIYFSNFNGLYSLNPANGDGNWVINPMNDGLSGPPAIGPDGTLYSSGADGSFYAINPKDGSIKWAHSFNANGYLAGIGSPCVGPDGTVYVNTIESALEGQTPIGFVAMDGQSGGIIWSNNTIQSFETPSVSSDGTLYVDNLAIDGANGNIKFTTSVTWGNLPAISADGIVYNVPLDGNLNAVDGKTGEILWTYTPTPSSPFNSAPAIGPDGSLYFACGPNLIAFQSAHVTGISLNASTVQGGSPVTATITLSVPAPTGGVTIFVASDNTDALVPATVNVPAGQTSATFTVNTLPVNSLQSPNISATPGIGQTANFTITPAILQSVSLNPTSIDAGQTATGTVTLSGPAGIGGVVVTMSTNSSVAPVPLVVTVPYGQNSANFTLTGGGVDAPTTVTITGKLVAVSESAKLIVNPATVASVSLDPSNTLGGGSVTGTLTLSGPAGGSGITVAVSSDNSAAVPTGFVTIPPYKSSATFLISTTGVAAVTTAQISATLSGVSVSAPLTINPPTLVSLIVLSSSVVSGTSTTGTVNLSGPAGSGGLTVALSSGNVAATVPSSITVASGQKSASFTITTGGVNKSTPVSITATFGGQSQVATLTVTPATLQSLTLSPSSVTSGANSIGTVTLSGPAGPGGTVVSLASSSPSAGVPNSMTVPAGSATGTFTITTTGVNALTTSTITATLNGTPSTATLTITPGSVNTLTLSPSTVTGGTNSTGVVTLSGPAGAGGVAVALSSSSSAATVPSSVTVAAGQSSVSFTVGTSAQAASVTSTITAILSGHSASANLTISAASLSSVSLSPSTVAGLTPCIGTVSLSGPAGPGGVTVSLSSSSSSASVPSTAVILAGQSTATFPVTTSIVTSVTTATIKATMNLVTQTAVLTLQPLSLASVTLNPSAVAGGVATTGTVALNGISPKGGTIVHLTSGITSATVPATVTILAGSSSVTFALKTSAVSAQKVAVISAKLGTAQQSASLTINPPILVSVSVAPTSVTGGAASIGTVTLSGPAPTGGMVVALKSNSVAVTLPVSVTIAAGKSSTTFSAKTVGVASQTIATITATLNGTSESATLTVNPPSVASLTLSPATVVGGKTSTATITLTGAAPTGGLVVTLVSNSTSAMVPVTVTVLAGKTAATFSVKTTAVSSKTTATISASTGGSSKTATLAIT